MTKSENVLLPNIPEEEYFGWDAINQSSLFKALTSMAHMKAALEETGTKATKLGSALHAAVLEPDRFDEDYLETPHPETWGPVAEEFAEYVQKKSDEGHGMDYCLQNFKKTKAWKEAISEFAKKGVGKTILKEDEVQAVKAMKAALMDNPYMHPFLSSTTAQRELSGRWIDAKTGLACKARFDLVWERADQVIIVDLKTANDATYYGFRSAVYKRGYDFQKQFYIRGYKTITKTQKPVKMLAFVVQNVPPYIAVPYDITSDEPFDIDYLLSQYKTCKALDTWPGPDYTTTAREMFITRRDNEIEESGVSISEGEQYE